MKQKQQRSQNRKQTVYKRMTDFSTSGSDARHLNRVPKRVGEARTGTVSVRARRESRRRGRAQIHGVALWLEHGFRPTESLLRLRFVVFAAIHDEAAFLFLQRVLDAGQAFLKERRFVGLFLLLQLGAHGTCRGDREGLRAGHWGLFVEVVPGRLFSRFFWSTRWNVRWRTKEHSEKWGNRNPWPTHQARPRSVFPRWMLDGSREPFFLPSSSANPQP